MSKPHHGDLVCQRRNTNNDKTCRKCFQSVDAFVLHAWFAHGWRTTVADINLCLAVQRGDEAEQRRLNDKFFADLRASQKPKSWAEFYSEGASPRAG